MTDHMMPEMPAYFGKNTWLSVHLVYTPEIGYILTYDEKDYEIISVTTYQEKPDKDVITTHVVKCLEVDENGDDAGNEPINLKIWGNSDEFGITVP